MDPGTTRATLLGRLGEWGDHEAWFECVRIYESFIRDCVRSFRLDPADTEEVCQRVWISLAKRLVTFRYDPSKGFRHWLRRLCRSRAIDLIRERKAGSIAGALDDGPVLETRRHDPDEDDEDSAGSERPLLLRLGRQVHDAVEARVGEATWKAFWAIAVEGASVKETAEALGMSYAGAFAAQKRVGRMLREEGRRVMAGLTGPAVSVRASAR
jgi:RNA polymerase sigma factor (sigma-70 family)